MPLLIEMFEWSEEKPIPSSFESLSDGKLFLFNTFIAHNSIVDRLVSFYSNHDRLLRSFYGSFYFQDPTTWASMLERVTCLFWMLLSLSETGRHLTFKDFPLDEHFSGQTVEHVDCDGRVYK